MPKWKLTPQKDPNRWLVWTPRQQVPTGQEAPCAPDDAKMTQPGSPLAAGPKILDTQLVKEDNEVDAKMKAKDKGSNEKSMVNEAELAKIAHASTADLVDAMDTNHGRCSTTPTNTNSESTPCEPGHGYDAADEEPKIQPLANKQKVARHNHMCRYYCSLQSLNLNTSLLLIYMGLECRIWNIFLASELHDAILHPR